MLYIFRYLVIMSIAYFAGILHRKIGNFMWVVVVLLVGGWYFYFYQLPKMQVNKAIEQGYQAFIDEDFEKAQQLYDKALEIDPDNGEVFLRLGDLRYKQEDYKNAVAYYKMALNDDYDCYLQLSKTYAALGNIKRSDYYFDKHEQQQEAKD